MPQQGCIVSRWDCIALALAMCGTVLCCTCSYVVLCVLGVSEKPSQPDLNTITVFTISLICWKLAQTRSLHNMEHFTQFRTEMEKSNSEIPCFSFCHRVFRVEKVHKTFELHLIFNFKSGGFFRASFAFAFGDCEPQVSALQCGNFVVQVF